MVKKKKRSVEFLQDHTVSWAIDRLNEIRDSSDDIFFSTIFNDEEKKELLNGYTIHIRNIMELMKPFEHEEENLFEWSTKFIKEYRDPFV